MTAVTITTANETAIFEATVTTPVRVDSLNVAIMALTSEANRQGLALATERCEAIANEVVDGQEMVTVRYFS